MDDLGGPPLFLETPMFLSKGYGSVLYSCICLGELTEVNRSSLLSIMALFLVQEMPLVPFYNNGAMDVGGHEKITTKKWQIDFGHGIQMIGA